MQGFRLAAMSDVQKTKLRRKNYQSQWTVKYRSRAPGQDWVGAHAHVRDASCFQEPILTKF